MNDRLAPPPQKLSLNTATVKAQWRLDQIIEGCARHDIRGISPWRDQVAEIGLARTAQLIRSHGVKAGLVLNPATPLSVLDHVLDQLDLVLIMSVNPGFGGQRFIESALSKIEAVRQRIAATGRDIWLEVDGGVNADNAARVAAAGADTLVAGSAVFTGGRYADSIRTLRERALAGRAQTLAHEPSHD